VCGNFGGPLGADPLGRDSAADLLFYDASTGTGEFYRVREVIENGILQVKLDHLQTHSNWRTTWTHVIPGQFGGDGFTDLLFYEASSGTGEFYATDDQGGLRQLAQHANWRTSWRHIVPGSFGGNSRTDLLFYDAAAGTGEFYTTNEGRLELLHGYSDWRASWSAIVPGDSPATVARACCSTMRRQESESSTRRIRVAFGSSVRGRAGELRGRPLLHSIANCEQAVSSEQTRALCSFLRNAFRHHPPSQSAAIKGWIKH
jgi:hypothetical protein